MTDRELIAAARVWLSGDSSGPDNQYAIMRALADRLEAIASRPGWVMVPREPTEEMVDAAMASGPSDATKAATNSLDRHASLTVDIWTAMLSALPPAPTESGWRGIESPPDSPMGVLFFVPGARQAALLSGHDYSLEVGYWNGLSWREQGTGHEINERSVDFGGNGDGMPTHWMPLPPSPEGT